MVIVVVAIFNVQWVFFFYRGGNVDVPAFPPSNHQGVQSVGRRGSSEGGILPNLVGPTLSLMDFFLRWGETVFVISDQRLQITVFQLETVHIPDTVAVVRQQTWKSKTFSFQFLSHFSLKIKKVSQKQ